MTDVGPLLASGRDADIFEYRPGVVLRRSRAGRSMVHEARIMDYVGQLGYPVPRVHDVLADGTELVMERIEGPSMIDVMARRPWTIRAQGDSLARLHHQLHELPAPEWLAPFAAAGGDRVGHFDLHPVNVMVSSRGPIVIDWTNAAACRPATDVAMTWLLLAAGQVEGGGAKLLFVRAARQRYIKGFLRSFDRREIAAALDGALEWKARDPNMSPAEIATMRELARAATKSEVT